MQQVLLAIVIFLGYTLLFGNKQQAAGTSRTALQMLGDLKNPKAGEPPTPKMGENWNLDLATMSWANATLRTNTASNINTTFQGKIDEDERNKKITPDEAKRLRMQGVMLVADTQYRKGLDTNDTNMIRMAFNGLSGWERKHHEEPFWKDYRYDLAPTLINPGRFPESQINPEEFYTQLREELSRRNRKDLVYGVFPGHEIIDALVRLTGSNPSFSYAFAAFLLALCVRAIIFPLAQRQLMWGRKMQQLQPLLKEIKAQYSDKKTNQITDQAAYQAKTMELYKEYGINPVAGCLPAFIQLPLFLTVYQFMLHYQFDFQRGYFLWINPSTSAASHGFFAPNLGMIDYTLLILYGVSMVTSTLLMPVSDPTQVKQQRIMGVGMALAVTAFMFSGAAPVPAAFVLYWTFTNVLATLQSLRAYRLPVPPLEKVNTAAGGVYPRSPFNFGGMGGGQTPSNGKANGKTNGTFTMPQSTGTPAKHKPKKRK